MQPENIILGDALEILPGLDFGRYKNPVVITDPPWNSNRAYPNYLDNISDYPGWICKWFKYLPQKKIIFPGLNHWKEYVVYNPSCLAFWHKRNGHSRGGNFQWSQGDPVMVWGINFSHSNVFEIPVRNGFLQDPEFKDHPNPQPIELIKLIIGRMRKKPDFILDPFCGTGTVIRAALDFNIPSLGIEIDPISYVMANKRLRQQAFEL